MSNKMHFTGDPLLDLGLNTAMKGLQLYKEINEKIKQRKMSNNKPKYRLKKDLPEIPAGTILNWSHSDQWRAVTMESNLLDFPESFLKKYTEWFEKVEEPKTWEIVQGGINDDNAHDWVSNNKFGGETCIEAGCPIYAVKRISDGVVFKVGDAASARINGYKQIITGFWESDKRMVVYLDGGGWPLEATYPYKEPVKFEWTDELVSEIIKESLLTYNKNPFAGLFEEINNFKKRRS